MGLYAAAAQSALQLGQAQAQAENQRIQSKFQASQMEQDAKLAQMQAEDAKFRGEQSATETRRKKNQIIGEQRAIFGASGVEIGSGSALDVQADTAAQAEVEALQIKNNAFREAMGYKMQAEKLKNQADITRKFGASGANMTLLGGGLQAAGTFGQGMAREGYFNQSGSSTSTSTSTSGGRRVTSNYQRRSGSAYA